MLVGTILLLKSILGDHFFLPGIRVSHYLNPSLILFLLLFLSFLLSKQFIRKKKTDWLVVIFLVVVFLTVFQNDYSPIQVDGDGVGYFAYLHSMYFDKDIDFNNEFEVLKAFRYGVCSYVTRYDCLRYVRVPETNMVPNSFSIGPSLLWMPFYHFADLYYRNVDPGRTGYEPVYINVLRFATIFYGLLGTLFLYFTLRTIFKPHVALLSIMAVLFCSPMYAFLKTQPFYSHVHSYFAVSLFMFVLAKIKDSRNSLHWMILGATAGLAALMRWQNAIFILVPIFYALKMLLRHELIPRSEIRSLYINLPLFIICFHAVPVPPVAGIQTDLWNFPYDPAGQFLHHVHSQNGSARSCFQPTTASFTGTRSSYSG